VCGHHRAARAGVVGACGRAQRRPRHACACACARHPRRAPLLCTAAAATGTPGRAHASGGCRHGQQRLLAVALRCHSAWHPTLTPPRDPTRMQTATHAVFPEACRERTKVFLRAHHALEQAASRSYQAAAGSCQEGSLPVGLGAGGAGAGPDSVPCSPRAGGSAGAGLSSKARSARQLPGRRPAGAPARVAAARQLLPLGCTHRPAAAALHQHRPSGGRAPPLPAGAPMSTTVGSPRCMSPSFDLPASPLRFPTLAPEPAGAAPCLPRCCPAPAACTPPGWLAPPHTIPTNPPSAHVPCSGWRRHQEQRLHSVAGRPAAPQQPWRCASCARHPHDGSSCPAAAAGAVRAWAAARPQGPGPPSDPAIAGRQDRGTHPDLGGRAGVGAAQAWLPQPSSADSAYSTHNMRACCCNRMAALRQPLSTRSSLGPQAPTSFHTAQAQAPRLRHTHAPTTHSPRQVHPVSPSQCFASDPSSRLLPRLCSSLLQVVKGSLLGDGVAAARAAPRRPCSAGSGNDRHACSPPAGPGKQQRRPDSPTPLGTHLGCLPWHNVRAGGHGLHCGARCVARWCAALARG
jgi:hypothetical protein